MKNTQRKRVLSAAVFLHNQLLKIERSEKLFELKKFLALFIYFIHQEENMKKLQNKDKLITFGLIVVLVLIMYILNIPCLFKTVFKIPCPGCGMTRAYISLLHLDFKKAFEYNPMFWSVPILFLLYIFDIKIFKKEWANTLLGVLIIVGFLANWLYKLIV